MLQLQELLAIPSNHHTVHQKRKGDPHHREFGQARREREEEQALLARAGGGAGEPGPPPLPRQSRPYRDRAPLRSGLGPLSGCLPLQLPVQARKHPRSLTNGTDGGWVLTAARGANKRDGEGAPAGRGGKPAGGGGPGRAARRPGAPDRSGAERTAGRNAALSGRGENQPR